MKPRTKYILRKVLNGHTHRITFYKPIKFKVKRCTNCGEKIYVVSHFQTKLWGFAATEFEAIKDLADIFEQEYFNSLRTRPSKSSVRFEDYFKYLREIIKLVDKL